MDADRIKKARKMLYAARSRSRGQDQQKCEFMAFEISVRDVLEVWPSDNCCPILGIPFDNAKLDSAPSLDRLDSKLGYVPGNIAVLSMRANRMKSDACAADLQRLATWAVAPKIPKNKLDFPVPEIVSAIQKEGGKRRGRPSGGNYRLRTTIPTDLGQKIEARAEEEFSSVGDIIADLLRKGLACGPKE